MTTTIVPPASSGLVRVQAPPDRVVYAPPRTSRGLWRDAWRRLRRNHLAMAGLVFIGFMVLVALFADVLPIPDPSVQFPDSSYAAPSPAHPLGNDQLGRDLLSRLIH